VVALNEDGKRVCRQFAEFVLRGGIDEQSIKTRLERLKFEQIVSGKGVAEILDEAVPGPEPARPACTSGQSGALPAEHPELRQ
jgi:hypothetical protein